MPNPVMHFEIIGQDAIALHKFYGDIFGWKLSPPAAEMGNYSVVDTESTGIGGGIGAGDPRVTIYIEVDDPHAYMDKVIKAGAKMVMEVTPILENITIGMFADPAGNIIGLMKTTSR